jgi:hypothetical protein
MQVTRDGVEKDVSLDKKKIDTEDNVAIMFQYVGRQRDGGKSIDTRGSLTSCGFALECGDVWPVNGECTFGVEGGDGAVAERSVVQQTEEKRFAWAPDHAVKLARHIGSCDVARGKEFLLVGDRGKHSVHTEGIVSIVRLWFVNIQPTRMLGKFHLGPVKAVND